MARKALLEIVQSKNFYRNNFRLTVGGLFISLILNGVLIVLIAFKYFTTPIPDFFATNSASNVLALKAMSGPNMSSKPLLKPDPPEEISIKQVPY